MIKFYENFQALNSAIHLDYWHCGFNLVFLNCIKNLVVQLIDMFRFPSDLGFKSLLPISTIKNLVFLNCISRPVMINSSIMTTIKMTMIILKKELTIKNLWFLFASIDLYIFKSLKYGGDWLVYILTKNSIISHQKKKKKYYLKNRILSWLLTLKINKNQIIIGFYMFC